MNAFKLDCNYCDELAVDCKCLEEPKSALLPSGVPTMMSEEGMTFDDYQYAATLTANYPETERIVYPTLGLASESGEVAGKIKKYLRKDTSALDHDEIAKELGDVLWYVAALASDLAIPLSKIAEMNIQKLKDRQQRGVIKGSGDNR